MSARIEDYALIGDFETAALVSRKGSIDWLCWPRFDSDACFAALLGTAQHGRWRIAPRDRSVRVTRRYRPKTLILETRFESEQGAATLIDFMPLRGRNSDVVRLVRGERGRVAMGMELIVRFGYGATIPWVTRVEDQTLRAISGPDMVVLRTPIALRGENMTTVAEFDAVAGETTPFTLTYGPSHLPPPPAPDPEDALEATERFWTDWADKGETAGDWSEAVTRSLITLKALIYAPTGAITAAATTSLPERLGGKRNWDYRFCWVRDAARTLLAFMDAGYYDEAAAWREWLLRATAGSPDQMQIMYGIAGERRLTEWEIPWLPGYEGARPVRVGNDAHRQLQLDVYGELMEAMHQGRQHELTATQAGWALQLALVDHLETAWREPDESIWEVRSGRRHFTFSKVMAWVAFDRVIRAVEMHGLEGPVERWREMRDEIHVEVCRRGFDPSLGSFVQSYDSQALDASLLLIPLVGFLPIEDSRVAGTIAAIEERLLVDGFVLRYDHAETQDGLPPGEGAFLACSFWLVDAYVLQGRFADARRLFERVLAVRNDLGLLSEQYDAKHRRLIGNFPQAFSHVALVISAFNLSRAHKPAEKMSGRAQVQASV
jgi:GH15 family glucan-1,4-alpha-glucosidase